MTLTLTKTVLLLGLIASTSTVHAGSTDGLNIAAIAHETALPYASSIKQFLTDQAADGVDCGEYALRLQHVYTSGLPQQLTIALALGAVKDKASRKKLGRVLTGFRNKTLERGFDGALVYEVKGTQLRLYGISGAADEKIVVSTLSVSDAKDQKKFNVAACKALASLPVLAEP